MFCTQQLLELYFLFRLKVDINPALNIELVHKPSSGHAQLNKIINSIDTVHFLQRYNHANPIVKRGMQNCEVPPIIADQWY